MKLRVSEEGLVYRPGRATGVDDLYCPWTVEQIQCGDWCPFCEIDDKQVVLHCTGTRVVYERITK